MRGVLQRCHYIGVNGARHATNDAAGPQLAVTDSCLIVGDGDSRQRDVLALPLSDRRNNYRSAVVVMPSALTASVRLHSARLPRLTSLTLRAHNR